MSLVMPPRSPRLRPFVSTLGYYEDPPPPGRERVLPSAMTALMVNLDEDEFRTYDGPGATAMVHRTRGTVMDGPSSVAQVIDTMEQRCVISVSFTLGGSWPFAPIPPSAMTNQLVELNELWGRDGAVLRDRLLEAKTPWERLEIIEDVLLGRIPHPAEQSPGITAAARLLEHGAPVAIVAERLGWLPGTLTRRFRERVGLTPKRFARVRRLQRLLGSITSAGETDWAEVAVTHGYYDQAHLVNDFRELAGITPTAYCPRAVAEQNHVPLDD